MKKNEYLRKLQDDNKKHLGNIELLMKALEFKIDGLKQSKIRTDRICERFDIVCYNYNLVYEVQELKESLAKKLYSLTKMIDNVTSRKSKNIDSDINQISGINDLLDSYEVQLKAINRCDISNVENLQLNAIKKEIYEKYMRLRAEIDGAILKLKFDKMQSRGAFLKAWDSFFVLTEMRSQQKENLFVAIHGIDDCKDKFEEGTIPTREYKIIDILADMNLYLNENKKARKFKQQYKQLCELKEKIMCTFSIEKHEIKKAVSEMYKSRLPMPVEKNMNKMIRKHQKAIEFLYKSGYIRTYEQVEYRSKMKILTDKIKLLSEHVEREINR